MNDFGIDPEASTEVSPARRSRFALACLCAVLFAGIVVLAPGALASRAAAHRASVNCPITPQEIKTFFGLTVTRTARGYETKLGAQCSFSTAALLKTNPDLIEAHLNAGLTKAAIASFFTHNTTYAQSGHRINGLGDRAAWVWIRTASGRTVDLAVAKGSEILDIAAGGQPLLKIEALARQVLATLK